MISLCALWDVCTSACSPADGAETPSDEEQFENNGAVKEAHLSLTPCLKQMEVLSVFHVIPHTVSLRQSGCCMLTRSLFYHLFLCNNSCFIAHCLQHHMLASDKRKSNYFLCLNGWIKKTVLFPPRKEEALLTCGGRGWRFNLSPNERPTASLSEAAEADCPESEGNCGWVQRLSGVESSGHLICKASGENKTKQKRKHFSNSYFIVWQCKMNAPQSELHCKKKAKFSF